jgi:hypothetical protein
VTLSFGKSREIGFLLFTVSKALNRKIAIYIFFDKECKF